MFSTGSPNHIVTAAAAFPGAQPGALHRTILRAQREDPKKPAPILGGEGAGFSLSCFLVSGSGRAKHVVEIVEHGSPGFLLEPIQGHLLLDGAVASDSGCAQANNVVLSQFQVHGHGHGKLIVHARLHNLQAQQVPIRGLIE